MTLSMLWRTPRGVDNMSHKPCFAKRRYLPEKVNAPQSLLYFNFYDIQASVLWRELAYLSGTNTRWNRENWQPFRRSYDQHPSIPPPWNLTGYIHKRHLYWNIPLSAYHKTLMNLVITVSKLYLGLLLTIHLPYTDVGVLAVIML